MGEFPAPVGERDSPFSLSASACRCKKARDPRSGNGEIMVRRRFRRIIHRIHPEGYRYLLGFFLLWGGVLVLLWYFGISSLVFWITAGTGGVLFLLLLMFFRNPRREVPYQPDYVVAPADGTVVAVEQIQSALLPGQPERLWWKISIFMPPWKPHINRAPVRGTVRKVLYMPGRYVVAWHPKSSDQNEQNLIWLERAEDQMPIVVKQIAGFVARRIRCYLQEGDAVECGQELGFIKLGSRTDLFLPASAVILVEVEDQVRAGETVVARLPLISETTQTERERKDSAFHLYREAQACL